MERNHWILGCHIFFYASVIRLIGDQVEYNMIFCRLSNMGAHIYTFNDFERANPYSEAFSDINRQIASHLRAKHYTASFGGIVLVASRNI
jgi:hypothetical protein